MRIELRGIIVGSEYDQDWAADYIAKGLIMPESRFRAALAAAPVDQPLNLYINSPGGSVFAANEMVNALRQWKFANSQPVNVTVGAMAASAASMIAIAASDSIRIHSNSKMMFHGAYTETYGGKQMHEDTAKLLEKINGDIKALLVSRFGMSPDVVSEWFAEGREGWLSADDMIDAGIATEIVDLQDGEVEFPKSDMVAMGARGLNIAALLGMDESTEEPEKQTEATTEGGGDAGGTNDGGGESGNSGGDAPGGGVDGTDHGDGGNGEPAGTATEPAAESTGANSVAAVTDNPSEREAFGSTCHAKGVAEGRNEATAEHAESVKDLAAKLESFTALSRKLQGERDAARAELTKEREYRNKDVAEMTAKLKESEARLARHLSGSLSFVAGPQTWLAAMEACGGDYAMAAKRFPELRRSFVEAKR